MSANGSDGYLVAATVLKVGHHGSRSSTGPAFAAAVNPQLAVIQVGENRYGHPNAEVLARLAGAQVLRTDQQGRIHVATDGQQVWVETANGWLVDHIGNMVVAGDGTLATSDNTWVWRFGA